MKRNWFNLIVGILCCIGALVMGVVTPLRFIYGEWELGLWDGLLSLANLFFAILNIKVFVESKKEAKIISQTNK
jgi:hypothetical protein